MSQMIQFGLNQFVKPKGFTFGKAHDIAAWRKQAQERRDRALQTLDDAHDVSGQELNPQNQKQQLAAKVDVAKRSELVQVFNGIFPENPVKLEQIFDPSERKSGQKPQIRGPKILESTLREQLKATILLAEGPQLKAFALKVNSTVRTLTAKIGMNDIARAVIDRVNYASRAEVIAMYKAVNAATKSPNKLLDDTGNMPKVKPAEQQIIEEQMRGQLRYRVLAMRPTHDLMAKTCREMMIAANANAPSYVNDGPAPKIA